MKMNSITQASITMVLISLLIGCSSSKETVIPPVETTMKEQYQASSNSRMGQSMRLTVQRPLISSDVDMDAYTLHNTPKTRFQLLDNPTLYMYVPAKLSSDRSPIPAFITEFKMYERDEYALPHEINTNWGQR